MLISASTQLDKGGYHLWVLNFLMLLTDKKRGSLHYFALHSVFFKKVTFKVDFLSMFEGFLCTCLESLRRETL